MTAFICRKFYFVLIVQCRELKIVEQLSLSSFFPSHFSILVGFFRSWRCSCPCQNHSAQISRIHSDLKSAPISTAKAKRIVHIWPRHYCGFYTAINLNTHHWCRFCSRFIADFSVDFKCEHTLRLGSHGCLNFGGISTRISALKMCSRGCFSTLKFSAWRDSHVDMFSVQKSVSKQHGNRIQFRINNSRVNPAWRYTPLIWVVD